MKRIALLGMPNCGKSSLFNRVTGASARIGNWPGITVDLMRARLLIGAHMVEMVDLPGIYDLNGYTDDEHVVRDFLGSQPVDLLVLVVNAAQAERQLRLFLQARTLGLPMVVLFNMADEARRLGIGIDTAAFTAHTGIAAHRISAKFGDGVPAALARIGHQLGDADAGMARFDTLADADLEHPLDQLAHHAIHAPPTLSVQHSDRIDRVALHPLLGPLVFIAAMALVFNAVFLLGAPLQEGIGSVFDFLHSAVLTPLLAPLPDWARGFLIEGVYNGVSTVATFVPLIVLFFFLMALVEDSGYLSRAAFLMDALMSRLGLDGRSFVMLVMGFGCNVPALMGTRIMRARPLRLLSMLIIPLSLCSARLQVFLFIGAAVFPAKWAPWALLSLYLFSIAAAVLTAWLFRKRFASREPFALELPPYRLPTARHVLLRGWHEVRHFVHRASRFIIAGVALVWLLTHLPVGVDAAGTASWAGQIGSWLEPLLSPIGIDVQLTLALLFGFVAKEVMIGAMAVIFGQEGSALGDTLAQHLSLAQAYSFMLFTLLYTPCLSTLATLHSESRSLRFTALAVVWPLALAWGTAWIAYQGLRLVGG
ncbi:ferrous iron transport protein B [Denitromonas iodatirespirans]|uniref:Ferrous iron transport protein B n=1 Tax=Denitromonas iodatirespirans TaxID=2795389 RepID=A0A944D9R4_DENI1|nr:ferrous iron transport protein B [Denitromonas iodatirespirans]MBT0961141.1 ferrous iron transport protein B [Denitromonas iodatirespirans]